jgi:hydrogenase expression/formation protein HypD
MKYIDEFRDTKIAKNISEAIFKKADKMKSINIMEVCGTHTMSICNFGIRELLPSSINLISGPGCPVCVTPKPYIDKAIAFSRVPDIIIATFGDMMRVPGSSSSLSEEKTKGRHVKVVYSALDAVEEAQKNPDKKVVFLGIGFETTAPTVAASLAVAKKKKIRNFFVYSGHKTIPPAMKALAEDRKININGFLCPAHVSAIIGTRPYDETAKRYKIPCVIAGFEPLDILQGILMLVGQIRFGKPKVYNQYNRVVRKSGNTKALKLMREVFKSEDSEWRGLGILPKSGLGLNGRFAGFDAEKALDLPDIKTIPDKGCICGDVLKGVKTPFECGLFAKKCTPEKPVGPCMVSSEGTCAAYYKWRR